MARCTSDHINTIQHLISCNMVTSALQDVPDVACILTASMVASRGRFWDALRKSHEKIPSRVIQWLTPWKMFTAGTPKMEVEFWWSSFSIMWFLASSPSFSRGCAFNIFQFVWAIFWPQVWEVMSGDALLCSDARSLFSASWWRLRVHAPCVYCQWRKIMVFVDVFPKIRVCWGWEVIKKICKNVHSVRRLLDERKPWNVWNANVPRRRNFRLQVVQIHCFNWWLKSCNSKKVCKSSGKM